MSLYPKDPPVNGPTPPPLENGQVRGGAPGANIKVGGEAAPAFRRVVGPDGKKSWSRAAATARSATG